MDSSKRTVVCVSIKADFYLVIISLDIFSFLEKHHHKRWHLRLSTGLNYWKKNYNSYTVEVEAFLENANVSKSTDISIQNIYQAIRNDDKVNSNLKLLYHETIYGKNKDVKSRIRNRIANFQRTLR